VIRVAAMADVHFGADAVGSLRPHLTHLDERADLLLVAGDLTRVGDPAEARLLLDELREVRVPIVAVLGNHDYHGDRVPAIAKAVQEAGVVLLEGDAVTIDMPGGRVGVAGVKGFGGGFLGASASDFGEPEMRAFVHHTKDRAARLEAALRTLDCDLRIALSHYGPTPDTLLGEPPGLYPFLGSYLLAEAIDRAGAQFAVHGHAHGGVEHGVTAGGTPVRNVAQPVLRRAYALYCFDDVGAGPVDLPSPPELAGWRYLAH
jgi:Icc-related predicted phosphoesterase